MIRVATASDVEVVAAIEQACFGPEAWTEGLVRAEVLGERHVVLLAGGDAYGAVSVAGDVADLDRIAVLPERRRQGLARAVLDALVPCARERGAARLLLEVAAGNVAATAFYTSYGFTTISRRRAYYRDGTDALVMQLDLLALPVARDVQGLEHDPDT
jgi:ribosomal-protein-alanine N-acetyltransferase